MAALFSRWSTTGLRVVIVAIILLIASAIAAPMIYVRTPYSTGQLVPVDQPVEFDHRHHTRDDGIECLYCHTSATVSPSAGIPGTAVCMGCHVQIWSHSPLLEPVRRSWATSTPIPWQRVHNLPDFVFFNHAIHVNRGIGCVVCHGRVDRMPRVYQVAPLTMGWCLDCHRFPRDFLANQPWLDGVTELEPQALATPSLFGAIDIEELERLTAGRAISRLTTCTACHR